MNTRRSRPARAARATLGVLSCAALLFIAGCGPVRLVAHTNIPTPLVVKMPIGVALFIPGDFAQYVHDEERWNTDYHIDLGKAQAEGITRLMSAMFERVVPVDSLNAGTQLGSTIRAILEPSIEEYAFVTPRDAGSPFYAVSIKYRVNVYMPDGKLADSWGFTGYGTSPSQGLSSEGPLAIATALAMRDAGAKLAVEFREQAIVRGLLPEAPSVDAAVKASRSHVVSLPGVGYPPPQRSVQGTSAAGTSAAGTPAAGTPATATPAAGTSVVETPAAETPAAEKPATDEAATDAPAQDTREIDETRPAGGTPGEPEAEDEAAGPRAAPDGDPAEIGLDE